MLSLHYADGAYRKAVNMLPLKKGLYQSRPGYFQVNKDNINRAVDWGSACVMEIFGGIYIWSGGVFEKIDDVDADLKFSATHFQKLRSSGNREDRLYVANGRTVYYIRRKNTHKDDDKKVVYEKLPITNELKDKNDAPYNLPQADFIETWRNRLWVGDGTNIIYHCGNDNPHYWDPLDAIAIQSGRLSTVTGLCAMGSKLIVSTPASLWQVTGNSPYNWQFEQITHGHGAINNNCMATDGDRLFYLDSQGVYQLGKNEPISSAIEDVFYTPDYDAALNLDSRGEYLYAIITNRLFVYNTYSEKWGEIKQPFESFQPFKGMLMIAGKPAWYGDEGLWLCGSLFAPDVWADGKVSPVKSLLRTWPVQPNKYGSAALNRIYINTEGVYEGSAYYRVYKDEVSEPMAESLFNTWSLTPPSITISSDPEEKLHREMTERKYIEIPLEVSWHQFEYEIESEGYVRFHDFDPQYQFTERGEFRD